MNEIAVNARDYVLEKRARPFTISIPTGRITGLSGLERGGQEEFLQSLCGLRRPLAGELTIKEKNFGTRGVKNLREAFGNGIAYLPRERKTEGILASQSVRDNFAIATLPNYSRFGLVSSRRLRAAYEDFATELGIVCESPSAPIRTLSGGNQQKVLLARWLAASPSLLLLNDPSRGVDHPTKRAMHALYRRLADGGTTIVLLSSEIEELLAIADSTVVFRDGSVQEVLVGGRMTRPNILSAMFGAIVE
ncbi:ATP-binding cassette domain-containing protein [Glaciihabitans sp. UYNi722]|uniref:ATP-binding cassette domain-containing protein n=1 Tax=Glaciihabitans sp. UYNi722 TaxID=3156344 RepID=UPI00339AC8E1